ncbi:hypothetical protein QTP88_010880 [Uroleucon formosanum]
MHMSNMLTAIFVQHYQISLFGYSHPFTVISIITCIQESLKMNIILSEKSARKIKFFKVVFDQNKKLGDGELGGSIVAPVLKLAPLCHIRTN